MKFVYEFRTSDNVRHEGVVSARDRESAFSTLKAQGIRPGAMREAPGFFNKLFGKGKRWIAIAFLAVAVVVSVLWGIRAQNPSSRMTRRQIYGDPVVLEELRSRAWNGAFREKGDLILIAHAIPGTRCFCERSQDSREAMAKALDESMRNDISISSEDLAEVATMKRVVNWMKAEMRRYVADGGTCQGYLDRLDVRQKTEVAIFERYKREIAYSVDVDVWRSRNMELRAMGLPMIPAELIGTLPGKKKSNSHLKP